MPTGEVTRCVRLEMPQGHEVGWNSIEIGIFADQHLAQGLPLPKIQEIARKASVVRAEITGHSVIRNGRLL